MAKRKLELVDGEPAPLDPTKCNGKKRQGTGLCGQDAGWGTPHVGVGHCKLHGGCAPSSVIAGERALAEREARELFGKLVPEIQPIDNPLAAFASLSGRVVAWMELMDSLLEKLKGVGYSSEYSGEQVHAEIQLYERAMDRANTVLSSYARLRIDERLAEITERQKLTVVRAIEAALDELGIAPDARADARREVARQLRLVHSA